MESEILNRNYLLLTLLWLLVGYISSFTDLMLFSYYFYKLLFIAVIFARDTFQSSTITNLVTFIMAHILRFILTFLATFLLTLKTGYKKTWLFAFIIGMTSIPIYALLPTYVSLIKGSSPMPSYSTSTIVELTIALLIFTPFFAYAGCYIGNKKYMKMHNPTLQGTC